MFQHIVLQGDSDLRELEFEVGRVLRGLVREGAPRFLPLGIRNTRPRQEVRAFWSVPGHDCGVRLVQDQELGIVAASVESAAAGVGKRVIEVLTAALPSVSVDAILQSEARFEDTPELVFRLALATRHAPKERELAIVRRLLTAASEAACVAAAGAAVLLGGDELLAAVRSAAAREDVSPSGRRVLEMSVHDLETEAAMCNRDEPFKDPEEVFRVRW